MVTDAECLHDVCFTDKLGNFAFIIKCDSSVLTAAPFESR